MDQRALLFMPLLDAFAHGGMIASVRASKIEALRVRRLTARIAAFFTRGEKAR